MKIHFLGTTGYHPNNIRQTACIMLPELGVIFDAGTGIFRARDLIQTKTLDILLSHVHLDHSIGLTFLYDVLHGKDMDSVRVHVAEDKIETITQHLYAKQLFPVEPNYELVPFGNASIQLANGLEIETTPLKHPGGCHGFKTQIGNKTLAYITDTMAREDAEYLEFIRGIDTLIHECYFPDGFEDLAELTGHSCLTPVAQVARNAEVGELYLVHINPLNENETPLDLATVNNLYDGNITIAYDGLIIDV